MLCLVAGSNGGRGRRVAGHRARAHRDPRDTKLYTSTARYTTGNIYPLDVHNVLYYI